MSGPATLLATLPPADRWPRPPAGAFAIPMQTRAWAEARLALLDWPYAPQLLAVEDGAAIAALAPLVQDGPWLAEPPAMFEPSDLIWRDEAGLHRLAKALARQPAPLRLDRVPVDSPTLAALRRAYAGRGLLRLREAMPTPTVDLAPWRAGPEFDPDAGFNAGRRADFRRLERRAAAQGEISYEMHAPTTPAELEPLLADAYAVEAASWKQESGTALSADRRQGEFFRRFTAAAAAQGMLRIAFLRLDGRPAAMQIAAEWGNRFWLFKISHDQACAACSPGQLLLRHTLGHAARAGLASYEFMGVMAPWTTLWTRQVRRYVQVRAIPFSRPVLALAAHKGARAVLHRLRRFVP